MAGWWTVDAARDPAGEPPGLLPLSNQLLLKTCRGAPDWSFTARLRGKTGDRVPGVQAVAQAKPGLGQGVAPELPEQAVNGFARVVSFSHELVDDGDYRGGSPGWVEHLYDSNGAVVWETAPAPSREATAFVFTALVSRLPGRAHLWVDGRFAVEFGTGRFTEPQQWSGNGFSLRFLPRKSGDYHSGVWILYVPKSRVEAGRPLQLRVSHVGGHRDANFMLKGRADTIEHERLTLSGLREDL